MTLIGHFTVYGKPETAGSKRAFVHPKTGRAIVTDANKNTKGWQHAIKEVVMGEGIAESVPLLRSVPLQIEFTFYMPRPKSHYATGKNAGLLKINAPEWHTTRPDALKLARAVEDALTGLLYHDDSAIVSETIYKRYGEPARADITIWEVKGDPDATRS